MKMDKKLLIGIFIILIIGILGFLWKGQKIVIEPDNIKYDNGGTLKMNIENYFLRKVCFSSCYPYFLEKKDGAWKSYLYQNCNKPDLIEKCIEPGKTKAFEIPLPVVKKGLHRIAVPLCENCKIGESFKETKRFYSAEFEIK